MNVSAKKTFIIATLSALLLGNTFAGTVSAFVNEAAIISSVNIRTAPSVSSQVIQLIKKGEDMHVLEKVNKYWLKVEYAGKTGYISSSEKYVSYASETRDGSSLVDNAEIISSVNMRTTPNSSSQVIRLVKKGEKIHVLEKVNNYWLKVEYAGQTGYVSASDTYVKYKGVAHAPSDTEPVDNVSGNNADKIIDFALSLEGKVTYQYGVRDEGKLIFDCSSFTEYVFKQVAGYDLQWGSRAQAEQGTYVDKGDLKKGDLVFFRVSGSQIGHVGIYIEDGKFVHNTAGNVYGIAVGHFNSGYWKDRYVTARRIL